MFLGQNGASTRLGVTTLSDLIPMLIDQNRFAHCRDPTDMMVQG
jgi:hypothetical protein